VLWDDVHVPTSPVESFEITTGDGDGATPIAFLYLSRSWIVNIFSTPTESAAGGKSEDTTTEFDPTLTRDATTVKDCTRVAPPPFTDILAEKDPARFIGIAAWKELTVAL
jgi:hypothetical protein